MKAGGERVYYAGSRRSFHADFSPIPEALRVLAIVHTFVKCDWKLQQLEHVKEGVSIRLICISVLHKATR